MNALDGKRKKLEQILEEMGNVVIAFSGGVDSALLLAVAARLYHVKLLAVTVTSISYAEREKDDAQRFAQRLGVKHRYIDVDQMSIPGFVANGPDRCYHCKKEIFSSIRTFAEMEGFTNIADGSNADDASDYRPGHKALAELGVRSPLMEAGLTKEEIRKLSREMGCLLLPNLLMPALPPASSTVSPLLRKNWPGWNRRKSSLKNWDFPTSGCAVTELWPVLKWNLPR